MEDLGGAARLSARVYAVMLRGYPSAFRREFGREMWQVFRDRCRESARAGGGHGLVRLWAETLLDLLSTAPREHAEKLLEGGRLMKTLRTVVLALAAYAFALLVAAPLFVRHREQMPIFLAGLADALIATGIIFNFVFQIITLPRLASGVKAVRLAGLATGLLVAALITLMSMSGGGRLGAEIIVAQLVAFFFWYALHLWWVLRNREPAGPPAHA